MKTQAPTTPFTRRIKYAINVLRGRPTCVGVTFRGTDPMANEGLIFDYNVIKDEADHLIAGTFVS